MENCITNLKKIWGLVPASLGGVAKKEKEKENSRPGTQSFEGWALTGLNEAQNNHLKSCFEIEMSYST